MKQISRNKKLLESKIEQQIECLKKGTQYLNLNRSASIKDGIKRLNNEDLYHYVDIFDSESKTKSICKFVPASGAATRMFKELYTYLDTKELTEYINNFFTHIQDFAFYDKLKKTLINQGYHIDELLNKKKFATIIKYLLKQEGLAYGLLPKGLLDFHQEKEELLTPIDEHIKEAKAYAGNNPKLVFTVSKSFSIPFKNKVEKAIKKEQLKNANFVITYQKPETDTIAVDMQFRPIKDENNNYVFRPGGHGSLIANLNEIDSDLIFIKNIDNVVIEKYLETTILYKKAIAGILIETQSKIFKLIKNIENKTSINDSLEKEIRLFIEQNLGILLEDCADKRKIKKLELYKSILDRPIRVCGMVKNEGEPGGGPFWVQDQSGKKSLQIVESSQIDHSNPKQVSILKSSTHFNPVDIVCGILNKEQKKYNLNEFVDQNSYFIAKKSFQGQEILALEHPGLWNGTMSNWNTIFIEVPIETFNPVKQVNDLLKDTHKNRM